MSRSLVNDIKNNFGQPLASVHTNLSGGASLASPASGQHLRVFKVLCTAPIGMSSAQTIVLEDGFDTGVRHTFPVPVDGQSELNLGSRSLRFDTSVCLTGPDENVLVTVFYDSRKTL